MESWDSSRWDGEEQRLREKAHQFGLKCGVENKEVLLRGLLRGRDNV